jgi:hypothetical protein
VRERGNLSIEQEITETGKQIASIYNLSRDLRSLGLINVRNKVFTVADEVVNLDQEEIISFLQTHLKRNRTISLILSELNDNRSLIRSRLAELLQELFPSVQAAEKTWGYYSKTTALWLHYARLVFYNKSDDSLYKVDDEAIFESAMERGRSPTTGYRFPMCFRNSIIECLEEIDILGGESVIPKLMNELKLSHQSIEKVLSDCLNLKFVEIDEQTEKYYLTSLGTEFVKSSEKIRRPLFQKQCSSIPNFNRFVALIEAAGEKGISSKQAAQDLVQELKLSLAELTVEKLGAMLANWAEYAGVVTRRARLCFTKKYLSEPDMFAADKAL